MSKFIYNIGTVLIQNMSKKNYLLSAVAGLLGLSVKICQKKI
jgi:hypothetical protein